ncbi:MAG: methyl-accepting chemotaxis protein [Candidatus Cohnella colombiensis]|uniref:Methyl-accepting chemotaxis protein n=1 Tax=Candidatus Cohnella colombiensis TaxID=3121368 RepID=A0AA95JBL3_9BACL|nr:MAG: methyl-accepting chemotaxis protein [Cohnella sp.]
MTNSMSILRMLFRSPKRSVGTRLFVLFVCIISVLVGGVGFISYRIASDSLIRHIEASSEQTISLAGEKLDMKMQFYLNVANQLTNNSSFTKNLFQITIPDLGKEERERRSNEIQDLFDQLALSDPQIRDITLIPLEDEVNPVSTKREGLEIDQSAAWVEQVRAAQGKAVWLPITSNGYLGSDSKSLFAYGQLLGRNNIGSREFILLIQIETAMLEGMIRDVQISQGGVTAIVDASGRLMTSNQPAESLSSFKVPSVEARTGSIQLTEDTGSKLYAYRVSPISNWTVVGYTPLKELTGAIDQIGLLTLLAIAGCLLIAFIIGVWLIYMIGIPMNRMEALMSQAAHGDFRNRLRIKGKDELANVSEAFNRMMQQIGELVQETRQTVNEVGASSMQMEAAATKTAQSAVEISIASDQIAQGAVELASNADRSNQRVELMGERLADALKLQDIMAASAEEVNGVCRNSRVTVDELIAKSTESEQRFHTVSTRIDGLSNSTQAIYAMLQFMTDLSKRIKILSLNASIEATRSGAMGAGFRVIADEIRKLAEQSGASIGQVGQLTETIHEEMSATVLAMTDARSIFKQLIGEVHSVHRVFEIVQTQMDRLINGSIDVTSAIKHLNETQGILVASIQEVSAVSQQSSASSEQVASLCVAQSIVGEELVLLSEQLKVSSFKLNNQMTNFQVE